MDRDKFIQRLRGTFLTELQEHVRVFNRELLALEQPQNDAAVAGSIRSLFRAAHSLKGASRAVQATRLEGVCHKAEELLAALRDGTRPLTPEVITSLFATADSFVQLGREFAESTATPGAPTKDEPPALRPRAADKLGAQFPTVQRSAAGPPAPAPADTLELPAATAQPLAAAPVLTRIPPGLSSATTEAPAWQQPSEPATRGSQGPSSRPTDSGRPSLGAASPAANQNLDLDAIVRVPGRKLDGLLAQSGELLIARRRFDARRSEWLALQDFVASVRDQWRHADPFLKQVLRTDGSASAHEGQRALSTPPPAASNGVGLQTVAADRGAAYMPTMSRKAAQALHSTRAQLARIERELEQLCAGMNEDIRGLDRAAQALEAEVHQVRMLPFGQACEGLFRAVRDLAVLEHKEVELVIEGAEVELDRAIVDALRDPLLHIVRNAVDHGVELPAQRVAAGKSSRARLVVSANVRRELVDVVIKDDGRGIDFAAVRAVARKRGVTEELSSADETSLIFEPGFSTASIITEVSGRGVGLDVVKSQIESMRGSVEVESQTGLGTQFTLTLPLTVSTLRVLFVRVGAEVFAFPSANVRRLVRAGRSEIGVVEGREVLLNGAAPVPIVALSELLGTQAAPATFAQSEKLPLVVAGLQNQSVALAVDELLTEQDVVFKPLGKRVGRMQHISAATILPTGQVALLLKPSDLVRMGVSRASARRSALGLDVNAKPAVKRLLLVDDSATIRTLEKSILEAAGYEISMAVDGAHAWQVLQERGADLVVSDVEMPNMDGFGLTQTIRASKRFRDLPVVLLTSLDSAQDRTRGLESGANAYLVKSAFDQTNLIETIRQLL